MDDRMLTGDPGEMPRAPVPAVSGTVLYILYIHALRRTQPVYAIA